MAFTTFNTTDTLEQVRVKLNTLSQTDFGDPALLGPAGLAATSVVGAVVELAGSIFSSAGFGIEDSTSSFQQILPGQRLKVFGTSNQTTAVVSVEDTLTIGLANNVTIPNNLTVTNNLTANGSLHTLGTIEISGNTIRSVDSTRITISDTVRMNAVATGTGLGAMFEQGGVPVLQSFLTTPDMIFSLNALFSAGRTISFEGATNDAFETTLTVTDPTADRTITLPDVTGTVITTGDTSTVTNVMLAGGITTSKILDDQITEAKIADDAVGSDQLKNLVTLQILNSSGGVLKTIYGAGA